MYKGGCSGRHVIVERRVRSSLFDVVRFQQPNSTASVSPNKAKTVSQVAFLQYSIQSEVLTMARSTHPPTTFPYSMTRSVQCLERLTVYSDNEGLGFSMATTRNASIRSDLE